eukprot:UN02795
MNGKLILQRIVFSKIQEELQRLRDENERKDTEIKALRNENHKKSKQIEKLQKQTEERIGEIFDVGYCGR